VSNPLLYQAECALVLRLTGDRYLWFTNAITEGVIIDEQQLFLLQSCALPRTIADHIALLCRKPSRPLQRFHDPRHPNFAPLLAHFLRRMRRSAAPLPGDSVQQKLLALADLGLLRHAPPSPCTGKREISTLGLITRDRPLSLKNALISHLRAMEQGSREKRAVVMDGSLDEGAQAATILAVREAAADLQATITYVGVEEKQKLCDRLAGAAPSEVIRFCLFGGDMPLACSAINTGANRNALLLCTVDELVLSADDDTCSPAISVPCACKHVRFASFGEIEEYQFGSEHGSASGPAIHNSFLCHEQLLGRPVSDIAGTGRLDPASREDLVSEPLLRLIQASNPQCCIGITLSGMEGHSGMQNPIGLLGVGGNSRAKLVSSSETCRHAFSSGQIKRSVPQPTVTDSSWCMMGAYGADHSRDLPPFLPLFRNQDGFFGAVSRHCCPEILFGRVPAVMHHSHSVDAARVQHSLAAEGLRVSELMGACIPGRHIGALPLDKEAAFCALGKHFQAFSELPSEQLSRQLGEKARLLLWGRHKVWTDFRDECQARRGFPVAELGGLIAGLETAISRPDCWIPTDLPSHLDAEEKIKLLRKVFQSYGLLLQYWPRILVAARALKRQGKMPGQLFTDAQALSPDPVGFPQAVRGIPPDYPF
jgi:hypothetical protein